ncbi:MAG: hypothetical protein GYA60_00965 [Candidatus Methanofastidiosa archaeon]|nr:hypothetical protein [Candidatus Methanofastidiosa archaeon]
MLNQPLSYFFGHHALDIKIKGYAPNMRGAIDYSCLCLVLDKLALIASQAPLGKLPTPLPVINYHTLIKPSADNVYCPQGPIVKEAPAIITPFVKHMFADKFFKCEIFRWPKHIISY